MESTVGRPPASKAGKKVKTGVSLDPELHAWVEARVGVGKPYSSFSVALEHAIIALKEKKH